MLISVSFYKKNLEFWGAFFCLKSTHHLISFVHSKNIHNKKDLHKQQQHYDISEADRQAAKSLID